MLLDDKRGSGPVDDAAAERLADRSWRLESAGVHLYGFAAGFSVVVRPSGQLGAGVR